MSAGIKKRQIPVGTEKFRTRIPNTFSVGDINIYPAKSKAQLSSKPSRKINC